MNKTFPKARVCVIDCYPSFESGLRKALEFSNKHNISLNASDGKKLILGFCMNDIKQAYETTKSQFPKVLCISRKAINKKIEHFVANHFDKMMEHLPFPYCGQHDLNSPDLETAAENSLKEIKSQKKFENFKTKLNLRNIN